MKDLLFTIDKYLESKPQHKVVFASYLGSVNYGLAKEGASDVDVLLVVVPSVEELLLSSPQANKKLSYDDLSVDATIVDIRNLKHIFIKPNLSFAQVLWSDNAYINTGNEELGHYFANEGLQLLLKNRTSLFYSTLGSVAAVRGRGTMTAYNKKLSLALYNMMLCQHLDEQVYNKTFSLESFSKFSKDLGTMNLKDLGYTTFDMTLYELKYEGKRVKEAETLFSLMSQNFEQTLSKRERRNTTDEELESLNSIVLDLILNHISKSKPI